MTVRLFVYGSLKKGCQHHDRMARARFEMTIRTAVGFRLVRYGAYPALVAGGSGSVEGEVYLVDDALLAELDVFEGCPDLYQRDEVELADGTRVETYLIDLDRARDCAIW